MTRGDRLLRVLAGAIVLVTFAFLVNNYLTFWREWPGALRLLDHFGVLGEANPLAGNALGLASLQWALYLGAIAAVVGYVLRTPGRTLYEEADRYSALAAYVVRVAFWATLLVGVADALISFLRVEELLAPVVGDDLTRELGRSRYRGPMVHGPLMLASLVIAYFTRSLSFIWLTILVVFAEFGIVISRFIYSYEQAFMGDLVRFWYAALFLFASAHTLVEEGHVRVDVFYANFKERTKAWSNVAGCVLLGWPLCWTILTQGMWAKGSSLNSPLLSYEISQSGFGMYTKYLMAAFLIVFAVSMIVQFASYFLANVAVLRGDPPRAALGSGSGH